MYRFSTGTTDNPPLPGDVDKGSRFSPGTRRHGRFTPAAIFAGTALLLTLPIIFGSGFGGKGSLRSLALVKTEDKIDNSLEVEEQSIIPTDITEARGDDSKKEEASIPQVLWQTAKSHNAPADVAKIMSTWSSLNTNLDQRLLDDFEVISFMMQHFNTSVVKAFQNLPLAVMRADFFRLAVMYHEGGIYADVDVSSNVPINDWQYDDYGPMMDSCDVVIGMENNAHVSNWGFASVKEHILFQKAIELSLSRFLEHVEITNEHFIHHTTGSGMFTDAVKYLAEKAGCEWDDVGNSAHAQGLYDSCRVTMKEKYNICYVDEATQTKWFQNHYSSQHSNLQSEDWVVDWVKAARVRTEEATRSEAAGEIIEGGQAPEQAVVPLRNRYSVLPRTVYSVIGLEASGTRFVSSIIQNAVNKGPYREGSLPCNFRNCKEDGDVQVQHFSLPWGGGCGRRPPPVVDVVLPPQCTRNQTDPTEKEECGAMAFELWGIELDGRAMIYPTRYMLDIVSQIKYYQEKGVDQRFIIVLRDEDVSFRARKVHCNNVEWRKEEEKVGTDIIIHAINTFINAKRKEELLTRKTFSHWVAKNFQPGESDHDNSRRRLDSLQLNEGSNKVVLVSYESLMKIGNAYVEMLYQSLGISSEFIPTFKNGKTKYLNQSFPETENSSNLQAGSLTKAAQELSSIRNFEKKWKEMKEVMCPKMKPNQRVWPKLFQQARMELNFANATVISDPEFSSFFRFSFGGLGYKNQDSSMDVVYLKIWKGGNSLIEVNWLKMLDHVKAGTLYNEGNQEVLYTNMELLHQKTPCIVTAVRDPVSHFLSAYNEVECRNMALPQQNRLPKLGQDPLLFTRFQPGTTERFTQFVTDFLAGPRRTGFWTRAAELPHLYSMTGVLFQLNRFNDDFGTNWTLSAYLPSLTNLSSNFPKLMLDNCPNMPPEVDKAFQTPFEHRSQKDEYGFYRAAKNIWNEGGNTARALCALHALDYACFDKLPIPDICKKVFSREEFIRMILKVNE